MKLFLALIGGLSLIPAARGETIARFYDHNGNPRGQLSQEGSRIYQRDNNGNPHGYYVHEGDRIVHYDNNGNPRGYSR